MRLRVLEQCSFVITHIITAVFVLALFHMDTVCIAGCGQVLYGLLAACGRPAAVYSAAPSSTTQQDQHNVLPLSAAQSRFQLLPVQSRLSSTSLQPPMMVQPHKSKVRLSTMRTRTQSEDQDLRTQDPD